MWGKLFERSSAIYDGKQKVETKRQTGLAFPAKERYTFMYAFKYENNELIKVLADKKIFQEYTYDAQSTR